MLPGHRVEGTCAGDEAKLCAGHVAVHRLGREAILGVRLDALGQEGHGRPVLTIDLDGHAWVGIHQREQGPRPGPRVDVACEDGGAEVPSSRPALEPVDLLRRWDLEYAVLVGICGHHRRLYADLTHAEQDRRSEPAPAPTTSPVDVGAGGAAWLGCEVSAARGGAGSSDARASSVNSLFSVMSSGWAWVAAAS